MKKRILSFPGRLLLLLLSGVLFISVLFSLFPYKKEEKQFARLTSQLFTEEMTANTLNLHYTLANPAAFGIKSYQPLLPVYDAAEALQGQKAAEAVLTKLKALPPQKLSPKNQYAHRLLLRFLENSICKSSFPYYEEPLSPSSGMQSQLPILLAEYSFRSKQDVTDYLSLLEQTDKYFASLLQFEQEKAAAGLLMPASSLDKVKHQCDTIVTKEALDSGAHFLQTTFQERLDALSRSISLSPEETDAFVTQNDRLLKTVLLPAYIKLADGLFLLEDADIPLVGLAAKPDGKAYYEQLLISETGSYRPIAEVQKLLSAKFTEEYEAIHALALSEPGILKQLAADTPTAFPYSEPGEMLVDLQHRMNGSFPDVTAYQEALPLVTVKPVSPSLEPYSAPAFYLTAPLDDTDNNVIYINERNSPTGLELYTTLAHEGYPGHLYQTVYSNRFQLAHEENMARQLLWYGGYQEGWAIYVEFLSYDYASELMMEANREADAAFIQLEKHNRSLQLCLYSLLDIMIHYENASYSQVAKVLESFGIKKGASIKAIYTYITEEPCNYLKYYLGYLEILALKEQAKAQWGAAYTDLAFHTFFLDCGPSDFTSLTERLYSSSMLSK